MRSHAERGIELKPAKAKTPHPNPLSPQSRGEGTRVADDQHCDTIVFHRIADDERP